MSNVLKPTTLESGSSLNSGEPSKIHSSRLLEYDPAGGGDKQPRHHNFEKWKKQKDEEYKQRKTEELRITQKKHDIEREREKQKKERLAKQEETIRKWKKNKEKEKNERKKEKMMIQMIEENMDMLSKTKTDKSQLIDEWVRLKNKQKMIENRKKVVERDKREEMLKMRQVLADISYKQWKQKAVGRGRSLPKNGFQMFDPKPEPVVQADWNSDTSADINPSDKVRHLVAFYPTNSIANLDYVCSKKIKDPRSCHLRLSGSGTDVETDFISYPNLQSSRSIIDLQRKLSQLKDICERNSIRGELIKKEKPPERKVMAEKATPPKSDEIVEKKKLEVRMPEMLEEPEGVAQFFPRKSEKFCSCKTKKMVPGQDMCAKCYKQMTIVEDIQLKNLLPRVKSSSAMTVRPEDNNEYSSRLKGIRSEMDVSKSGVVSWLLGHKPLRRYPWELPR